MALTPCEAFKVGFLSRCVLAGLQPEQILTRVKLALDLFEKRGLLDKLLDAGGEVLKGGLQYGGLAAAAAPPILGGLAGYGLAKATDIDDTDVTEIKNRELVEELRRQAGKLHRQKAVRDYQHAGRNYQRALI